MLSQKAWCILQAAPADGAVMVLFQGYRAGISQLLLFITS